MLKKYKEQLYKPIKAHQEENQQTVLFRNRIKSNNNASPRDSNSEGTNDEEDKVLREGTAEGASLRKVKKLQNKVDHLGRTVLELFKRSDLLIKEIVNSNA